MSKILLEEPVLSLRGFENDPREVSLRGIARKAVEAEKAAEAARAREEQLATWKPLLDEVRSEEDSVKALEMLFDALVPQKGPASSEAGELVRAIMRLLYRDLNDGDKFFYGYGLETCAPSAAYLMDHGFYQEIDDVLDAQYKYDDDYEYTAKLYDIARAVVIKILNEPELLVQPASADSREYDTDEIESRQERDSIIVDYPWEIEQLLDDGEISERDIRDYIESALEWESECEGFEIYHVSSSDAEIGELTRTGRDRAEELLDHNFWSELIAEHEDALTESAKTTEHRGFYITEMPGNGHFEITSDVGELVVDDLPTRESAENYIDEILVDADTPLEEQQNEGLLTGSSDLAAAITLLGGAASLAAKGLKWLIRKWKSGRYKPETVGDHILELDANSKRYTVYNSRGEVLGKDIPSRRQALNLIQKHSKKPVKQGAVPLTEGVRPYTNAMLDMASEFGVNGWAYDLIQNLLSYMSEDEVRDFATTYEYLDDKVLDEAVDRKALTEDTDPDKADKPAPLGPQMGQDSGIAALLNSLIRDEWEAIQGYNDMQNAVKAEQPAYADEFLRVIADINAEENVHVGQLQKLMELVAPNAQEFNAGEKEAEEQIHDAAETEENEGRSDEV